MERLTPSPRGFKSVPRTGVIYVITEARKLGFCAAAEDWSNLGQGAPETGYLEGGAPRIQSIRMGQGDHEYAPIDGIMELRQAVAELYNHRFRQGKKSQYTYENVAISSGGRLALTRLVSTLGRTNVGHFLPDYTAYEELLDAFGTFVPIPVLLDPDRHYAFSAADLRSEILGRGLSAVLLSNPCNPTGKAVHSERLKHWIETASSLNCTLILDEFYSHYIYGGLEKPHSAARYVEDVNADPIVILDGVTKNWRYPGWRVAWTVAPKDIIEATASAGSFLDGGCARPMQMATLDLVSPAIADLEAETIQHIFEPKREALLAALKGLNIEVLTPPDGGFYCWGDLSHLPHDLNTGMRFFRKALEHKVIVVPGEFFDINPGRRRPGWPSRFRQFARFSFGPSMPVLERGIKGLKKMIHQ